MTFKRPRCSVQMVVLSEQSWGEENCTPCRCAMGACTSEKALGQGFASGVRQDSRIPGGRSCATVGPQVGLLSGGGREEDRDETEGVGAEENDRERGHRKSKREREKEMRDMRRERWREKDRGRRETKQTLWRFT